MVEGPDLRCALHIGESRDSGFDAEPVIGRALRGPVGIALRCANCAHRGMTVMHEWRRLTGDTARLPFVFLEIAIVFGWRTPIVRLADSNNFAIPNHAFKKQTRFSPRSRPCATPGKILPAPMRWSR